VQLIMFSKMLQDYNIAKMGDEVKAIGLDGIDLTVRSGGHILPEDAARHLSEAVDVLRERGLTVPMITTGITSSRSKCAEEIMEAAVRSDVRLLKLGYWPYEASGTIMEQVNTARRDLDSLAPLAEKHGVTLCLHTHSGDFLTATPALMLILLANRSRESFGAYADLGHLTNEGGMSGWKIGLDLLADRLKIVAAKGMGWWYSPGVSGEPGNWTNKILPVRDSMVRWDEAFDHLKQIGFDGPVSVHSEYKGDHSWVDLKTPEQILAQTKVDVDYLRQVMARTS
jgi:sugar phosphate isomerase/epimerase